MFSVFFFFKQKTAYEMRISDWSSDVCSSDLRRRMCPAYIAGLIGPGDRKSVQPMASRASEIGYDQLHHFVAAGVWGSAPLEKVLVQEADRLVGDAAGFLVIDDPALPKKGTHSVGVAPQSASSLVQTAHRSAARRLGKEVVSTGIY